jgi:peptidoglycan-N-acetylglucosamine deacetylase
MDEIFVSNNKRLAYILSLIKYDFQADFKSLKEIKGIKQTIVMDHIHENLQSKEMKKVEKQEIKKIKSLSKSKRKEASSYLGLIGSRVCLEALERALILETDSSVKIYISNALTDIKNPDSLPIMIDEIRNTKKWYREKAISNILEFGYEIQPYFEELRASKEIEHIELWIKYANENFNRDTKDYLFHFIDHYEQNKIEILTYYKQKNTYKKDEYKLNYLEEDIEKLLPLACKTLAKYYYAEFAEPCYYQGTNYIIQINSLWALSKLNKTEHIPILLSYIEEERFEKTIITILKKMVEMNPKFLSVLEVSFKEETNEIVKCKIAQVLSSRIEYYILKLNTKNDAAAEKIILEIIKNREVNELIGFLNMNKNYDIENRLIQIIKENIEEDSEVGIELRTYLIKSVLTKWGVEPVLINREERKNKKDKKLVKIIVGFTILSIILFPSMFSIMHWEFVLIAPFQSILKKYVIEFNFILVFYSIAVNFVYIALMLLSYQNVKIQAKYWNFKSVSMLYRKNMIPSVSIIAPAYNEELTIIESAKSLLNLNYPDYELIIVNDGSKDETLNKLIQTFRLTRVNYTYTTSLNTMPVLGIYRNPSYPKLVVVNKSNGGKADSLNAGINVANKTYFCGIDADSLLEPDALLKLASITLDENSEIPALGGNVFPINGCTVDNGFITRKGIAKNKLAGLQMIEYMRSFMAGRLGWEKLNCLLIISGAFGLFRKDRIIEIGGYLTEKGKYNKDTVGEDMELVVRISRRMLELKHPFKIKYCFHANCWTEVPEDLKSLKTQRYRWHRGLIDILFFHKKMLFNYRYGKTGMIALPYFLFFEAVGPMIEIQGYFMVVLAMLFGIMNVQIALLLFISVILFGMIVSMTSLFIAEREQQYFSVIDIVKLIIYAIVENFGVKQLLSVWRLGGQLSIVIGKGGWGHIKRKGQKNESL